MFKKNLISYILRKLFFQENVFLSVVFLNIGLNLFLSTWVEKIFLEINEKYYPQFIQIFYANLTIDQDNIIYSRVGGINVTLSVDDLAYFLILPNKGYGLYKEHFNSFED